MFTIGPMRLLLKAFWAEARDLRKTMVGRSSKDRIVETRCPYVDCGTVVQRYHVNGTRLTKTEPYPGLDVESIAHNGDHLTSGDGFFAMLCFSYGCSRCGKAFAFLDIVGCHEAVSLWDCDPANYDGERVLVAEEWMPGKTHIVLEYRGIVVDGHVLNAMYNHWLGPWPVELDEEHSDRYPYGEYWDDAQGVAESLVKRYGYGKMPQTE